MENNDNDQNSSDEDKDEDEDEDEDNEDEDDDEDDGDLLPIEKASQRLKKKQEKERFVYLCVHTYIRSYFTYFLKIK